MSNLTVFLSHPEPCLLLVDGSSFLYRAYHGLPDLRSPTGEPTGALYGILSMLKKLRLQVPTQHAVCVFDAKGKTFRDDWYAEYKATRESMPEDLAKQVEPIQESIIAMGWPVVVHDGVEADDVIGTLTRQALDHGWRVVIATGDKDLTQLVTDKVLWFNTMSQDILDPQGVKEKFGVMPDQIIDYLTLVGDTADNIPGVDKVGPKTAAKWLNEYGSLDQIVAQNDKIGGKVGENLRNTLDWLPMGRRLVTVVQDLDLTSSLQHWQEVTFKAADQNALLDIYRRSGFKTWTKETEALLGANAVVSVDAGSINADPFVVTAPAPSPEAPVAFASSNTPLQDEGDEDAGTTELTPFEVSVTLVNTPAALNDLLIAISTGELVAIDTETTSLDQMLAKLVGLSFAINDHSGWYIPLGHQQMGSLDLGDDDQSTPQLPLDEVIARLKPWFEDQAYPKIGHHLKYDRHVLANHGIALAGVVEDTLLQSYVLRSEAAHKLESIGARLLKVSSPTYVDICGKGVAQIPFEQVAIDVAASYSVKDVAMCLAIHQVMRPRISQSDALNFVYQQIEMPTASVLFDIERYGVKIDVTELHTQAAQLGRTMMECETRAYELAGQPFNLNSPKQIAEIFFEKMGLPVVKKTAKGAPSTDEDVLSKLAEDYPLPKTLLTYRSLAKLKSTYVDKLPTMVNPATGRIHTNYGQATAVTGRLSSNDPNLQNIPIRTEEGRKIRHAFIPSAGRILVCADYSQVELRILAHLSQDNGLLSAFKNNEDVHIRTASQVFATPIEQVSSEQRRMAKAINFGLVYGMSAFGLSAALNITRTAASQYIDQYFIQFPQVLQFMEQTKMFAREHGYVETYFGRRLYLSEINSRNQGKRQGAERAAINAPMQGTSADLIKLAMVAVQQALQTQQLQSKIIMQVHDELVLDVPQDELSVITNILPQLMSGVADLHVPLLVEIGQGGNWEVAH